MLDAGSDGPLTLVTDTRGSFRLLRAPIVGQVTDVHVGPPLDVVYNNSNINVKRGWPEPGQPDHAGADDRQLDHGLAAPESSAARVPAAESLSRQIFAEEPTAS